MFIGSNCIYDNLTLYDRIGSGNQTKRLIDTYCGDRIPNKLTLKNSVMLILKTDQSSVYKGFEIDYELQGNYIIILYY